MPKSRASSLGVAHVPNNCLADSSLLLVIFRLRPPTLPCAFAAARPAFVRSVNDSRSIWVVSQFLPF